MESGDISGRMRVLRMTQGRVSWRGGDVARAWPDMASARWCSRAPSDSAASRIGAAAFAPPSATARITSAAASSTRPAGHAQGSCNLDFGVARPVCVALKPCALGVSIAARDTCRWGALMRSRPGRDKVRHDWPSDNANPFTALLSALFLRAKSFRRCDTLQLAHAPANAKDAC